MFPLQIASIVRRRLLFAVLVASCFKSAGIVAVAMTRETWPTAEDKARSPSPQFISRQLSRVDYEDEDAEAEQLIADGPPLVRVPLFRTGNPTTLQNAAAASHSQQQQPPPDEPLAPVPAKHEEEENPMNLEDIVSKQVELAHEQAPDDQDWKGDEVSQDPIVESEPYKRGTATGKGAGVNFILGGSVLPKHVAGHQKKQTEDSLFKDDSFERN